MRKRPSRNLGSSVQHRPSFFNCSPSCFPRDAFRSFLWPGRTSDNKKRSEKKNRKEQENTGRIRAERQTKKKADEEKFLIGRILIRFGDVFVVLQYFMDLWVCGFMGLWFSFFMCFLGCRTFLKSTEFRFYVVCGSPFRDDRHFWMHQQRFSSCLWRLYESPLQLCLQFTSYTHVVFKCCV